MSEVEIQLSTHLYVSKLSEDSGIHQDNIQVQESYVYELLGMMKCIDVVVWGRDLLPELQFPVTWADAFRLKFFPKWLLEKYPARIRYLNIRELYPEVSKNPTKINATDFLKTKNSVALIKGGYTTPPL